MCEDEGLWPESQVRISEVSESVLSCGSKNNQPEEQGQGRADIKLSEKWHSTHVALSQPMVVWVTMKRRWDCLKLTLISIENYRSPSLQRVEAQPVYRIGLRLQCFDAGLFFLEWLVVIGPRNGEWRGLLELTSHLEQNQQMILVYKNLFIKMRFNLKEGFPVWFLLMTETPLNLELALGLWNMILYTSCKESAEYIK